MFNEYCAVVIGGFIIALISMLLNKIFDGQKQVDSLRALVQSNRPSLVQIGELYHIPWTEELDRADSLIRESATVSRYNFYALYDISNRSTCLISEISNKMKVAKLVAASAAAERGWEQRQRNPEPEPADLPPPSPPARTATSPPHPINLHLHLHSPSLPQKPEEEWEEEKEEEWEWEEEEEQQKKNKKKRRRRRRGFPMTRRRRCRPHEDEERCRPHFEHHKEREEQRIAPLPHEEEKKAPCEGKIEYASEEENLPLSSDEEPLQSVRPPISSPTVSLSNEEIPPQTLPSVISSPPRRRRGGIGG